MQGLGLSHDDVLPPLHPASVPPYHVPCTVCMPHAPVAMPGASHMQPPSTRHGQSEGAWAVREAHVVCGDALVLGQSGRHMLCVVMPWCLGSQGGTCCVW